MFKFNTSKVLQSLICGTSAIFFIPTVAAQASPFQHVLIISVDGLHGADLTDSSLTKYMPNITSLEKSGIMYTNAFTTNPSDSFPGTTAILTGAHPKTTGIYYDDSYSRTLTAPIADGGNASSPVGTELSYFENVDKNSALLNGGGDYGKGSIDSTQLPQDCSSGTCKVVNPWQLTSVNNIFSVANQAGLYTYFSDKHSGAYTIAEGQSGNAVSDMYSPEINATNVSIQDGKLVTDLSVKNDITKSYNSSGANGGGNGELIKAYDDLKVNALINAFNGLSALGTNTNSSGGAAAVPALAYMNFQAVSVAEKAKIGGIPTAGNPSAALIDAVSHTDASIGSIMQTLKANGQDDSTLVVLTAKHGQDPRVGVGTQVAGHVITDALSAAGINVAQATQDDVGLFWLKDQGQTAAAVAVLQQLASAHPEYGIDTVYSGANQPSGFGNAASDSRTPDITIKEKQGYIFVGSVGNKYKNAEHGGFNPDDVNVGLILSSAGLATNLQGTLDSSNVDTTQIASTALEALGLDPNTLTGAVLEGTQSLPTTGLIPNPAVPEPTSILGTITALCLGFGLKRHNSKK